ncbi:acyltransferas-like protein [Sporormia fimetaria CBS 119925]|uniref:Acyltransferas-like protein n=1 Tax=Sporormia fimetaria CBS 119925 TaxID=1340428 RepID=A0A6A6V1V8_9PLEO|nr:acyltransferas-like protein [Sporormia fimetaria CBS 119925]
MPSKPSGLLDQNPLDDTSNTTWKPRLRWSIDTIRPHFLTLRSVRKPINPTAWLDGLRGFAAFMVYIHHHQLWAHDAKGNRVYENSFGFEGQHYFAALPFIRLFFAGGHFAVAVFFVISGYVLSLKTLTLLHKSQIATAIEGVGSALFRRWLRLYIPVIGVSLVFLILRYWSGIWVDFGDMDGSFWNELRDWYYTFKNYSFVFTGGLTFEFAARYHPHAWTIPYEMRGSIIVYTALSAFSKCTRKARLWCEVGLVFYFLYVVDGWYGAVFCAGMLLCDLDLLAQDSALPNFLHAMADYKEIIFFHLFIISLYLGGVPACEGPEYASLLPRSPGWKWLSVLKPQAVLDAKWFFLFWASVLLVASVQRLVWLKSFFETRFCQYLGRISFALYLMHGPVMLVLADRLYAAVGLERSVHKEHIEDWKNVLPISRAGPMGFELAFWAVQLVVLPVTLYTAEVVTKVFDEPSIRISSWLYARCKGPPAPVLPPK